ncbi:hypothetical protein U1E44_11670 [Arenibacter sp. GZD96]|uniref:hypothetical protein n=1 Tax=Aurantibrevibacter litoralis TaxID=3106030 RepID=UPI002AFF2790|nr:hypothetical protein [Arenibacter sp. GZD-96]MEA1786754.1 hypothetical protein [Arenibacter sp. GZD-96]
MRIIVLYFLTLIMSFIMENVVGQEPYHKKIELLEAQKEPIATQEREALKKEVADINKRLENKEISTEEAIALKEAAAKKRALNIDNRTAIITNRIELLQRNEGKELLLRNLDTTAIKGIGLRIDVNGEPLEEFFFDVKKKAVKYDRRTYSDFVLAFGLNNALIDGQSLEDSPYKIGGSRFFEMGWAWRTRVFQNTNFMRINYGFSFQFNGLKPKENQFFVNNNGQTELQEFEFDLRKSKLRMDNLVFPVHFEFGPSKLRTTEKSMRYSLDNQFRIGLGAYGGVNLGTRQKLKFNRDGERVKEKFNGGLQTSNFIYGLSAYAGIENVLLYLKYDLNPIFRNALVEQRTISLGLRFDL